MAALDFKRVLDTVGSPDRESIWHLTGIARDNVEEAANIAKVIEADIKETRPQRKLVPFYVLDSIVKNVGSPYNVYFGFALFACFFDAYCRVDGATRKSMEAMLRTWKQPVPNTLETDPVFPAAITGPIEKALETAQQNAQIKTQSAFVQQPHHSQQTFSRLPHALPSRPPENVPWFPQSPPVQFQDNGYHLHGQQQSPHGSVPASTSSIIAGYPYPVQQAAVQTEHQILLTDVDLLLKKMQSQLTQTPWSTELRGKIDNVMQLQHALHTQQLPISQWTSIQDLVATLLAKFGQVDVESAPAFVRPSSAIQHPYHQPQVLQHQQHQAPRPTSSQHHQPSQAPPAVVFDSDTLAALAASLDAQRGAASQTAPPTSNHRRESSEFKSLHSEHSGSAATISSNIDQAAIAGLYHRIFTPNQMQDKELHSAYQAPPGPAPLPHINGSHVVNDVRLENSMLKTSRPELQRALWQNRSLCRTCGRRFLSNIDGKARKARHLDYHFRSNMRREDSSRGAVVATRSWFMDEPEWIKFREVDDADEAPDIVSNQIGLRDDKDKGSGGSARGGFYVRIPGNRGVINPVCPICQEGFKATWQAELQDWVWPDCIQGKDGRYFHSSCIDSYKEDEMAAKDREADVLGIINAGQGNEEPSAASNEQEVVAKQEEGSLSKESGGRKRKAEELDA